MKMAAGNTGAEVAASKRKRGNKDQYWKWDCRDMGKMEADSK